MESIVEEYKKTMEPALLERLQQKQMDSSSSRLTPSCYMYLHRLRNAGLPFYNSSGDPIPRTARVQWLQTYICIGDLETWVQSNARTKMSDTQAFEVAGKGTLEVADLLFLIPKRALIDGRNEGICDVRRYFAVGRADANTLQCAIGDIKSSDSSLFSIYGATEEDKALTLRTHSLRHLQNTELFRLGVADTIITKRFNRRSVKQSYEYDHRSLAERLEEIELPDEWDAFLANSKAGTVAKLIQSGEANGPIVNEFRRIQQDEGDQAAFVFLKAEADGFHSTPYGHCINSFTVDPCPKHLECFTGCRHLSATNLPENRKNLLVLQTRLEAALETARNKSVDSIGRDNQIAHAISRLEGVKRLLETATGELPFPDGPDLSMTNRSRSTPLDG